MAWVAWAAAWVAWAAAWAVAWAAACDPFRRPACRLPISSPNQTRHLPTRLVSLSSPDPEEGLSLPQQGEKLQILGDIAKVNDDPRVQKALRRLAADKAPTSVSQLVMWRVAADWTGTRSPSCRGRGPIATSWPWPRISWTIWTSLTEGETGRLLFEIEGTDAAEQGDGGRADQGPARQDGARLAGRRRDPDAARGPAVACRVRLTATEALVQVASSDATARTGSPSASSRCRWSRKRQVRQRQVRRCPGRGDPQPAGPRPGEQRPAQREKGKLIYQIRIENASPLILNGLALVGTGEQGRRNAQGAVGHRDSPAQEHARSRERGGRQALGLKKGIKVLALDLSGL